MDGHGQAGKIRRSFKPIFTPKNEFICTKNLAADFAFHIEISTFYPFSSVSNNVKLSSGGEDNLIN